MKGFNEEQLNKYFQKINNILVENINLIYEEINIINENSDSDYDTTTYKDKINFISENSKSLDKFNKLRRDSFDKATIKSNKEFLKEIKGYTQSPNRNFSSEINLPDPIFTGGLTDCRETIKKTKKNVRLKDAFYESFKIVFALDNANFMQLRHFQNQLIEFSKKQSKIGPLKLSVEYNYDTDIDNLLFFETSLKSLDKMIDIVKKSNKDSISKLNKTLKEINSTKEDNPEKIRELSNQFLNEYYSNLIRESIYKVMIVHTCHSINEVTRISRTLLFDVYKYNMAELGKSGNSK